MGIWDIKKQKWIRSSAEAEKVLLEQLKKAMKTSDGYIPFKIKPRADDAFTDFWYSTGGNGWETETIFFGKRYKNIHTKDGILSKQSQYVVRTLNTDQKLYFSTIKVLGTTESQEHLYSVIFNTEEGGPDISMTLTYEQVIEWLDSNGWVFDRKTGTYRRKKVEDEEQNEN